MFLSVSSKELRVHEGDVLWLTVSEDHNPRPDKLGSCRCCTWAGTATSEPGSQKTQDTLRFALRLCGLRSEAPVIVSAGLCALIQSSHFP